MPVTTAFRQAGAAWAMGLNALKQVPEVCRIFCATANPTQVAVAETAQGRGILGVIDGSSPLGVEGEADVAWRKGFLRQIGYKLG